jgi:hypothetical protein
VSGYLQGQVWFRDVRGSERDVLLALADHAHDDGTEIRPSMEYLAWKVGVGKRQAQRIVSSMRDRGALIVVRESTRYEPTHYRMDLEALPLKAAFERPKSDMTSMSSLNEGRDDRSTGSGVTDPADRGDTQMSPESSKETSQESSTSSAREGKVELPEDFPEELRPHLKAVYRVLRDLAQRHGARAVAPVSLANVIMARPHKPLVTAAHDFASWADGKAQRRKDVVSGYRRWLDNVDDLAGTERMPGTQPVGGNVVAMPGREAVTRMNYWQEFYDENGAKEGMR